MWPRPSSQLLGVPLSLAVCPTAFSLCAGLWIKFPLSRDFPGGALVKNQPCNAQDMDSTPGLGTKIPHAKEQLISLLATTRRPECCNRANVAE